ncbi:MAG: hypothetical protein ABI705_06560 [Aestuariivirga sp.]
MAEALLEGESATLVEKLIELAQDGNMAALRPVMERLVPPRRERPLQFELPPLVTAADAPGAISCIVAGLAAGQLTASEVKALVGLVEAFLNVHGQSEIGRRMSAIEARLSEIVSDNEAMSLLYLSGKG